MEEKIENKNFFKEIYAYIAGEKSKTLYISSEGENIIPVPLILGILFLLVFDIPSLVIAVLLLLLIVFNLDLSVSDTYKSDKLKSSTVKASEYKSEKKEIKNKIKKDSDGYCEITIS